MGLATPTSIMVGTGRGAELGVLFRKGEALQALQACEVVAFDKTGTLTEGKPGADRPRSLADGLDRAEVLAAGRGGRGAVRASDRPRHRGGGRGEGLALPRGRGFRARSRASASARAWRAGGACRSAPTATWRALGHRRRRLCRKAAALAGAEAQAPLYAAIDGRLAALIAVADPVKPTTPAAIAALHGAGPEGRDDHRRQRPHRAGHRPRPRHRRGGGRGACRSGKVAAVQRLREGARPRWPLSATASTTPRRWPRRMWASRSAPARTSPSRRRMWC